MFLLRFVVVSCGLLLLSRGELEAESVTGFCLTEKEMSTNVSVIEDEECCPPRSCKTLRNEGEIKRCRMAIGQECALTVESKYDIMKGDLTFCMTETGTFQIRVSMAGEDNDIEEVKIVDVFENDGCSSSVEFVMTSLIDIEDCETPPAKTPLEYQKDTTKAAIVDRDILIAGSLFTDAKSGAILRLSSATTARRRALSEREAAEGSGRKLQSVSSACTLKKSPSQVLVTTKTDQPGLLGTGLKASSTSGHGDKMLALSSFSSSYCCGLLLLLAALTAATY